MELAREPRAFLQRGGLTGLGEQPVVDDGHRALVGERGVEGELSLGRAGDSRRQEHGHHAQDLLSPGERHMDAGLPVELLERRSYIRARSAEPAVLGVGDHGDAAAEDDVSVGQILDAQAARQGDVAKCVGNPDAAPVSKSPASPLMPMAHATARVPAMACLARSPRTTLHGGTAGELGRGLAECSGVAAGLPCLGGVAEDGGAVQLPVDFEGHVGPGDLALGAVRAQQRRCPQAGLSGELLGEVLEHRLVLALGEVGQEVRQRAQLLQRVAHDPARRRIGVHVAAVGRHDHDAVPRSLDYRGERSDAEPSSPLFAHQLLTQLSTL